MSSCIVTAVNLSPCGPESDRGHLPARSFVSSGTRDSREATPRGKGKERRTMNRLIQLNGATVVFFVVLGLGCFCLSPLAHAQGCPSSCTNDNTVVGTAFLNNPTGRFNTAIGSVAFQFNTTGHDNTASGRSTLYSNTTGGNNTANGVNALYSNTT